ncbi:SsgA family sporulation/cell division regulator [Streptomyces sp. NPDC002851]
MPDVVDELARAHVVTDTPDGPRAVRVTLHYDPADAPGTVRLSYPGAPREYYPDPPREHEWTFERDVLERGLKAPTESGDVRVWPCGRAQTVIEFHTTHGVAVLQFDCSPLLRFLRRTHGMAASLPH